MKNRFLNKLSIMAGTTCAILFSGCGNFSPTTAMPPVKNFDLKRYMGKWYEIARLPHNFESNITDAQADYTLLSDGTIEIVNSGLRNGVRTSAHAVARPAQINGTAGELEVSFFYPFYTTYKIIYLNKDYTLAIVTGNSINYVWILARKPVISRSELAMCLEMLKKWGFAVKLLQYPSGMVENLTQDTTPAQ